MDKKEDSKPKWGAVSGALSGAGIGSTLGAYSGFLHPDAMKAYMGHNAQIVKDTMKETMEGIDNNVGEDWKSHTPSQKPFGHGKFNPGEAKERMRKVHLDNVTKKARNRILKNSAAGLVAGGALGALSGYARVRSGSDDKKMSARDELDSIISFKIKIDPKNKGRLTATEKRSGKDKEELADSKNPKTRKRAQFAINAAKWNHSKKEMGARDELGAIINLKAVDLGYSYGDCGLTAPSQSKKSYPSLYISDRDSDIDLPLTGTATVKYKLRSKTIRQDEEGKKRHSADIEIQSIDPIEEEQKGAKQLSIKLSVRDQLDLICFGKAKRKKIRIKGRPEGDVPGDCGAGASALSSREELDLILFADPRPRNPLGEFSGNEEGLSPNVVATVYKQPQQGNSAVKDIAIGAGGGLAANAATAGIRELLAKAKKARG